MRRIEDLRFECEGPCFWKVRIWVVCMLNRFRMELKAQRSILTQSACCSRLLSNSLLCFTTVFVFVGFEEFSWDRELQPQPTRPVPAKNEKHRGPGIGFKENWRMV